MKMPPEEHWFAVFKWRGESETHEVTGSVKLYPDYQCDAPTALARLGKLWQVPMERVFFMWIEVERR